MLRNTGHRLLTILSFLSTSSLLLLPAACGQHDAKLTVTNVEDQDVTLFWLNPDDPGNPINVGEIPSGDGAKMNVYIGHEFQYEIGGIVQTDESTGEPSKIVISDENQILIIGPTHIDVACTTSTGTLHAHIFPEWSPFGAARFLHLVRSNYFDGCALNRVVPKFLTQFGISANYEQRTSYRSKTILDDEPREGMEFQPGYMAYAGSGPNSRTTEMFIVMPDTPSHQLQAFGNNPWETPFGFVSHEDVDTIVAKWYAYGDMPPWGQGPDPQQIYPQGGYDSYLKEEFPYMSYIEKCEIVSSDFDGYDGFQNEEEEL